MNDFLISRVEWWRNHYREFYCFEPDFSNLYLPYSNRSEFERLIVLPRGFKIALWVEAMRRVCNLDLLEDMGDELFAHDRWPGLSYAVWIRDRQEADGELRHLSADELKRREIPGITLLERLVAGSAYFSEKGQHLDQTHETLCSGSRRSDGKVPGVRWRSDLSQLYVGWCTTWSRGGHLCSREVVV